MKKTYLITTIILFILSCKKNKTEYFYKYNGQSINVELITGKDSVIDGFAGEIYKNGNLKSLAFYKNGKIVDTLFLYHKNGLIKEKGLIKDNRKIGWWSYFDSNGHLKKKAQYITTKDSLYINQQIYYDKNGKIKIDESSFFVVEIPDTLVIGKNIGHIKKYVPYVKKADEHWLTIIIENKYSETEIKKDTFSDGTLKPFFGIYAYKKGKQIVKGKIEEKTLKTKNLKDSASLLILNHYKLFEKEVYVWDKKKHSEIGLKLLNEADEEYKK